MTRINTLGIAAILALATACSNTAKGVEQDVERAGEKVEDASARAASATEATADSAGASMRGAFNTADVKTALLADSRLRANKIDVDSDAANKTVTLKGSVPTVAEKMIAEEITKAKAMEYTVINNLTIKPN